MNDSTYIERMKTANFWADARPVMLALIAEFARQPETVGVVILGGLADRERRHFIDQFSDLDLALFLTLPLAQDYHCPKHFAREHPQAIPSWLPPFQFFVPVRGTQMEVNCHQLIIEIEANPTRPWPSAKQEAYYDTGEVVYDRAGVVRKLISDKCKGFPDFDEVTVLASQLPWYAWINPERQLQRGFPENSRVLINQGIEILLKLVFAANSRYWTHLKWQFEIACDLPWLPQDFRDRLGRALYDNAEHGSICRAIAVLRELGGETLSYLRAQGKIPPDPFGYVSIHIDIDRQLSLKDKSTLKAT